MHESIIHMVKEFKDVNPRILTLTLNDKDFHIVLINIHAPTEDEDDEEKKFSVLGLLCKVLRYTRGDI